MRVLVHLPIIHGTDDLGSVGQSLRDNRAPEQAQQAHAAIQHFWDVLETAIESFKLDYPKVRIYQDGLPVCGQESAIVAETASAGSRNFKLIQALEAKGATVMGTESPEWLREEYALMRRIHDPNPPSPDADPALARALLERRDTYIAQRIDTTLRDGEMGLLFLGLLHNIEDKLPKDIQLLQPLGKPKLG